ncbi:NUDIX hydrolase [Kitasatospora sp. NBC_01539]|uniref:NUDIX hydrolase n=1 Tax=Kitasatospora sp. NBC_01539 TaxID=2903577 RepID=UPI0038600A98
MTPRPPARTPRRTAVLPWRRTTSRLLLVDGRDRLLLLCARDPRGRGARWWFTVGGAVEKGEDHVQAALRELREETGLRVPADRLGPVVWTRRARFRTTWRRIDQDEEYRLLVITDDEAAGLRIDPHEARYGHRWWSAADLAATRETVRPRGMDVLLPAVLAGAGAPLHLGDVDEDTEPDRAARP